VSTFDLPLSHLAKARRCQASSRQCPTQHHRDASASGCRDHALQVCKRRARGEGTGVDWSGRSEAARLHVKTLLPPHMALRPRPDGGDAGLREGRSWPSSRMVKLGCFPSLQHTAMPRIGLNKPIARKLDRPGRMCRTATQMLQASRFVCPCLKPSPRAPVSGSQRVVLLAEGARCRSRRLPRACSAVGPSTAIAPADGFLGLPGRVLMLAKPATRSFGQLPTRLAINWPQEAGGRRVEGRGSNLATTDRAGWPFRSCQR
jgi:hypothetical protein